MTKGHRDTFGGDAIVTFHHALKPSQIPDCAQLGKL